MASAFSESVAPDGARPPRGAFAEAGTLDEPICLGSDSDDDTDAATTDGWDALSVEGAGKSLRRTGWATTTDTRAEQERRGEREARRLQRQFNDEDAEPRKKVGVVPNMWMKYI